MKLKWKKVLRRIVILAVLVSICGERSIYGSWLVESLSGATESIFGGACTLVRTVRQVSVKERQSADKKHARELAKLKQSIHDCEAARALRRELYSRWYDYKFGVEGACNSELEHDLAIVKNSWVAARRLCKEEYQYQVYEELLGKLNRLSECLGASKRLYVLVSSDSAIVEDDNGLWAQMFSFLKSGARADIRYTHESQAGGFSTFDVIMQKSDLSHKLDAFYADKKIGRSGMVLLKSDPEDDDEQERRAEDGSFEIYGFIGIEPEQEKIVEEENGESKDGQERSQ